MVEVHITGLWYPTSSLLINESGCHRNDGSQTRTNHCLLMNSGSNMATSDCGNMATSFGTSHIQWTVNPAALWSLSDSRWVDFKGSIQHSPHAGSLQTERWLPKDAVGNFNIFALWTLNSWLIPSSVCSFYLLVLQTDWLNSASSISVWIRI